MIRKTRAKQSLFIIHPETLYCVFLFLLFMASISYAGIIADSEAEFSGIQGMNNWYYGYYDGDSPSGQDFEEMTIYDPTDSLFYDPDYGTSEYGPLWTFSDYYRQVPGGYTGNHWTAIGPAFMHPTARGLNFYPVRRWISEVEGTITITGTLSIFDPPNRDFNLDGIIGCIALDENDEWTAAIDSTDTTGINYSYEMDVHIGSAVDFVILPNILDTCDHARFTAQIEFVPEPASFLLLALGGLLVRKKGNIFSAAKC